MGRDVPWDEDTICDGCGESGAFDFMGDYICSECYSHHATPPKPEQK